MWIVGAGNSDSLSLNGDISHLTIALDGCRIDMRIDSATLFGARQVANLGGFMSGVNNNGAHSANGITAMFIATGQDAANVAELWHFGIPPHLSLRAARRGAVSQGG